MLTKKKSLLGNLPKRHLFFLNPYTDVRFSSCPKCNAKTKIRKKPFLIHIDPNQLLILNMSGPFCPHCDLMILHKDKLEALLAVTFEQRRPEILGNDYLVMGTMERNIWLQSLKEPLDPKTTFANVHIFKNVLKFEPPRWQRMPNNPDKEDQANRSEQGEPDFAVTSVNYNMNDLLTMSEEAR